MESLHSCLVVVSVRERLGLDAVLTNWLHLWIDLIVGRHALIWLVLMHTLRRVIVIWMNLIVIVINVIWLLHHVLVHVHLLVGVNIDSWV